MSPVSNALQSLLEYQNLEKKFLIVNSDLAFNDGGIKVYIMARVIRVLELSVFRRTCCDLQVTACANNRELAERRLFTS